MEQQRIQGTQSPDSVQTCEGSEVIINLQKRGLCF